MIRDYITNTCDLTVSAVRYSDGRFRISFWNGASEVLGFWRLSMEHAPNTAEAHALAVGARDLLGWKGEPELAEHDGGAYGYMLV